MREYFFIADIGSIFKKEKDKHRADICFDKCVGFIVGECRNRGSRVGADT